MRTRGSASSCAASLPRASAWPRSAPRPACSAASACWRAAQPPATPGWEDKLLGAEYTRQGVVTDGNITTGRGVGFCLDMGLELVRLLKGDDFAADLRRRVQYPGC